MAKNLSIFVESGVRIQQVVSFMSSLVGHEFNDTSDDTGTRYQAETFTTLFVLYDDHGFENDQGITFSKYDTVIGFQRAAFCSEEDTYSQWLLTTALFIANKISNAFHCEVIVVSNLQILVKTFNPKTNS